MKITTYHLKFKKILIMTVSMFIIITGTINAENSDNIKKKISFVVTNHDKKGNTGESAGFYFSEATYRWEILDGAGYEVDFISLKDGKAPIDGLHLRDRINKKFWNDLKYRKSEIIKRGGIFKKSGLWQSNGEVDQHLITGQNPQSVKALGQTILQQLNVVEMTSKITKYEVKKEYLDQFKKALSEYVLYALASKDNIMAEALYEQDKSNILWLIERWNSKNQMQDFNKGAQTKSLESLSKKALKNPSKIYYVKDLEPLTKEQWRTTSKKEDNQLVVMLFIDAKLGTQQNFKDTYHIAMPQFRSEPGVVTYQLSEIEGDDTQFVTYEKFRSNEAFQYHLNFPPIKPVLEYLQTSIKQPPFQNGLHNLIEFAPMTRE